MHKEITDKLSVFNHLRFEEENHIYYDNGVSQKGYSVSKLIGKYEPEFDTEFFADRTAKRIGVSPETVKEDWARTNKISTVYGSAVHLYIEGIWNNKKLPPDVDKLKEEFPDDYVKIIHKFSKSISLFKKFLNDRPEIKMVRTELVLQDKKSRVCGMVDLLAYNSNTGKYELWDYKTNKKIRHKTDYKTFFHEPFNHLDVCELNNYSLQLGIYKNILEKTAGIEIDKSTLMWLNPDCNDDYVLFPVRELDKEAQLLLDLSVDQLQESKVNEERTNINNKETKKTPKKKTTKG